MSALTREEIEHVKYRCRPNPTPHNPYMVETDNEKALIVKLCDMALQSLEPKQEGWQPIRPEVYKFALLMEARLKRNDHRGGWGNSKPGYFHERIQANLVDLGTHRANSDWEAYRRTCADIGNFAMMLADNAPQPPSQEKEPR